MKTAPRIAIIGGTIWGNRGAESMLVTVIGMLRQSFPACEFTVYSYYPRRDRLLVKDDRIQVLSATPPTLVLRFFPFAVLTWFFRLFGLEVPERMLPRVIRALRSSAVLLDIGGISFVDGREIFLPFNVLAIWPAMLLGIPVVKMAQALGPFHNPINFRIARAILPRCKQIFARGELTARNLDSINIPYTRAADIAFLYQPEFSLSRENDALVQEMLRELDQVKAQGSRIVTISPSSLVYAKAAKKGRDHLGELLRLVQDLDDGHTHFLFVANSTKEDSGKPRNNDIYVLNRLRQRAMADVPSETASRMHWVMRDINTASLRKLIQRSNLIITSRFHAMVSGLSLGVPTLVLGWSHKYIETLSDFGMESFAADFGDSKVDLAALAREILANEPSIRAQLSGKLTGVQASSRTQFTFVERILR